MPTNPAILSDRFQSSIREGIPDVHFPRPTVGPFR
jgi:hypothetical protein